MRSLRTAFPLLRIVPTGAVPIGCLRSNDTGRPIEVTIPDRSGILTQSLSRGKIGQSRIRS